MKRSRIAGFIFFVSTLPFALDMNAQAQCDISIDNALYNGDTYITPDTLNICLGDAVQFFSTGGCPTYMMNNDFNNGNIGVGWFSNASPMFNNPCGPGTDGTTYLWIGPASNFPRELTTIGYNVTTQCQICFDMKYASQSNSTPCEGPDEPTEGVHLQYSTVGPAGPWFDINYWDPLGGYDPMLTNWNNYCESIPVNGMTWFRWYQTNTSGNDYDHWGIDNVQIFCPPLTQTVTWTANGSVFYNDFDPSSVSPVTNTLYEVIVSDGSLSDTDYVYVTVFPPPAMSISGLNPVYCITEPASVLTGNPSPGVFSGPGISGNTFTPANAGLGTHTVTYDYYYITTNTSTGPQTVWSDDFSTNTGWTGYGAGGWTRGSATASSGCSGSQDPSLDHTTTVDNFIIGNYLGACYPNSMTQTYWLTSPVINCTNMNSCQIEFWSFSGCESSSYDHMYVDVSGNGGATWTNVYSNAASFSESAWTLRNYNTTQANNSANFRVRFGMGPTDGSVIYSGWNIDDFSVKCTGTMTVTDTLCAFSTTQDVDVYLQPESYFSFNDSICSGTSVNVTYTGSAGPALNYNWSFAGGNVISGSGQGPYVVDYQNPGTFTISLTVDDNICSSITTQDIYVFDINGPFLQPDTTICSGTTITLQATGAQSYLWSDSSTNTAITVNPASTTTYYVTATNAIGCTSTDDINVTVIPSPVANAGPDASVCSMSDTLQAIPSVGTGTWTVNPSGTISIQQTNNPASPVQATANGTYIFTWTEDNGNGCISSDNVSVTFTQQPAANAGPDISVCLLGSTLAAVPSVGNGTWTQVSGPGVITFTPSTSANASVNGSLQGVYVLQWLEDNGNGCTSSDDMTLTLTLQPVANAGINDSVCGLVFNLNATPSVGTGTWSMLSGQGTAQFSDINSPASDAQATLYGFYTYVWSENNGNGCISSDTIVVKYNYIPTSSFGVTNINCYGDTSLVTYTGNAVPAATYNWNFGSANILSGADQGPYQVNYTNDGSYLISLQVTQNGCVSAVTTQNLINPQLLNLSLAKIDPRCNGFTDGSVFSTTTGGTLPYTYVWSDNSPLSYIANTGIGTYSLTVTDYYGCTLTSSVTLYEPPLLVVDVPASATICNDSAITVVSSCTGGVFPYNYMWNTGSVLPNITVSPDTTTVYIITAFDANGCTSADNIQVNVYPPLNITATASAGSICLGESITITASVSGGNSPLYTYTINNQPANPPFSVYPNQPLSTYYIRVRDACNYLAQDTVVIIVHPLPPINPSSDILSGCEPLTVHFNEGSPDQGQTFVWDFGDGESAFTKNPAHVFESDGIFDITLTITSIYGCKIYNYYNDWITVYPLPNARFVASPATPSTLKPIVNFYNYSELADSVRWFFGDGDSSSVYNPVHNYMSYPGLYDVTLIAYTAYGCTDTAVSKVEIKNEYTFYAPTAFSPDNDNINEIFFVSGTGLIENTFQLFVYDRWGELIFRSDDINKGWDGKVKNGKLAPAGVYTWLAIFRDFKKILHEKAGTVTLIR